MGDKCLKLILFICMFVLFIPYSWAADYYISPTGSGSVCTIGTPCASFTTAQGLASGGDTIYMHEGTWPANTIIYVSKNNITLKNVPGETPTLDPTYAFPTHINDFPDVLFIGLINVNANNVTIDGIKVRRGRGIGIQIRGDSNIIKNCWVELNFHTGISIDNSWKVDTFDDNIIEYNTVLRNNYAREVNWGWITWNNISNGIAHRGKRTIVRHNIVAFQHSGGIEGFRNRDSLIEYNLVYGNGITQIHEAGGTGSIIRYNICYGVPRPSIDPDHSTVYDDTAAGTGSIDIMCELFYNGDTDNVEGDGWDYGHEIYGNLIANIQNGIRLGFQGVGGGADYPNNTIENVKIYNNTIIDPTTRSGDIYGHALVIYGQLDTTVTPNVRHVGPGHVIKNNIFFSSNSKTIAYGSFLSANVAVDNNLWSKAPAGDYQGENDPGNPTYPALNKANYYTRQIWDNVVAGDLTESDFNLLASATQAIDQGVADADWISFFGAGSYTGAAPDVGGREYNSGIPTTDPVVYTLDSDGVDSENTGTDYDLTGYSTPDHTGGTGLVCDDATDGYYRGPIFDSDQITVIVGVDFVSHGGVRPQILVSRSDYPNELNWYLAADASGYISVSLGYNTGINATVYSGASVIPTDATYYLWATIDGTNHLLNMGILDTSGSTSGIDISGQSILAGQIWNYAESDFLIGARLVGGQRDGNYYPNGTIYHAEVWPGILPKTTIVARVVEITGGGAPASPKAISNCWSDTTGACLSKNQQVMMVGQAYCQTVTINEEWFSDDGPGVVAAQTTISALQSLTMPYSSGYGTVSMIFCDESVPSQRFGELQLLNTNPISTGTTTIKDAQGNTVDLDGDSGLDNSSTYHPVFQVETKQRSTASDGAAPISGSGGGQPVGN